MTARLEYFEYHSLAFGRRRQGIGTHLRLGKHCIAAVGETYRDVKLQSFDEHAGYQAEKQLGLRAAQFPHK